MSDQIDALIARANAAMRNAYAPYSGFKVGAAVLGCSGSVYAGCNVENASYGLSVCSERVAVFQAICAGEKELRAIAVAASSDSPAFPCGACRQVLSEFTSDPASLKIYLVYNNGVQEHTLAELLPHAFKL